MPNVNWQFQAAIPGGPCVLLNQPYIPQNLVCKSGSAKKATVRAMAGRSVPWT
jgi:hypothetical protein